jgi:hypothetical protein
MNSNGSKGRSTHALCTWSMNDNACGQAPGPSSDFADLKGTAMVTGVGFFDVKHATPQTGVAPNNIELHPVLRLSGASCSR